MTIKDETADRTAYYVQLPVADLKYYGYGVWPNSVAPSPFLCCINSRLTGN